MKTPDETPEHPGMFLLFPKETPLKKIIDDLKANVVQHDHKDFEWFEDELVQSKEMDYYARAFNWRNN